MHTVTVSDSITNSKTQKYRDNKIYFKRKTKPQKQCTTHNIHVHMKTAKIKNIYTFWQIMEYCAMLNKSNTHATKCAHPIYSVLQLELKKGSISPV